MSERDPGIILVPDGTVMFWRRIVDEKTERVSFETVWMHWNDDHEWAGRGRISGDYYREQSWYEDRARAQAQLIEAMECAEEEQNRAELAASLVQMMESRRLWGRIRNLFYRLRWRWRLRRYRREAART